MARGLSGLISKGRPFGPRIIVKGAIATHRDGFKLPDENEARACDIARAHTEHRCTIRAI